MKSAPGRDRTGLEDRPATFGAGWRRRGYTTGRAGRRRRQLSNCVFPRGRAAALGARGGAAELAGLRPQPSSPRGQLRLGILLLPTLQQAARLWARRVLRAARAQPLGALGARGRRPVRGRTASRPPSVPLGAPLRGPARTRVQESGGRAGLPARVGGVWAPLEARGVSPPSPPGSPPALSGAPARLLGSRSPPGPGALSFSPAAAPGVGGEEEGRARPGSAAGERWVRQRALALPPAISRQREVADTQETLLTAQSLLPARLEPGRARLMFTRPSRTPPGVGRSQAAGTAPLGNALPWPRLSVRRDRIPGTGRNLLLREPSFQRKESGRGRIAVCPCSPLFPFYFSISCPLMNHMLINSRHW